MKQRKIPARMCVACREMKPKRELVRLVLFEGEITVDGTGKAPGRGAYICAKRACAERAMKTRAVERALEGKLSEAALERMKGFPEDE